jgi:bifunctional UDP-N-acetylglucosamine pyrophosphorylase / glucosamine-1-phosphate N-acetyltransferase
MKENVAIVILAAGLGTRMKSKRAKVLHEVGGDTLLNNVIRAALQVAPAEKIVAVIGHQAEQVRESVKIAGIGFAVQAEQKGTAHAVLCAKQAIQFPSGQLLILNGDGPLLRPATLNSLLDLQRSDSLGGAVVSTEIADATGYGRVLRDEKGLISAIVEQKAATREQLEVHEINTGLYCFDAALLWKYIGDVKPDNPAKEYYLPDMIDILTRHGHPVAPLLIEDETELLGINTRIELAFADKILRARKSDELMLSGVTIENPESVTIDIYVEIGEDSLIEANVQLRGHTRVGANCRIATGTVLRDCEVGDNVTILPYVVAEASVIGANACVGPFSRLRMHAEASENAHIGNFVELKKTKLGRGAKANHLAYLGDSVIGSDVNIGAGTITCNYDGQRKHETTIADGAFVGSNSTLVAPLTIGTGAFIAAGSVITKNVASDSLAIGRAYQLEKAGWAKKRQVAKKGQAPIKLKS